MSESSIISIVDDDESARAGAVDLLTSTGFAAEAFPRAVDFLNSGHLRDTLCLIAGVQMPGMTGTELHSHLLKLGKAIPTILVAAYPDEEDRMRARRAGVIGYLVKPYSQDELLACIWSAIGPREEKEAVMSGSTSMARQRSPREKTPWELAAGYHARFGADSPSDHPFERGPLMGPKQVRGCSAGAISFGLFRLCPAQRLLLHADKPVPLGSRALDILIALVEQSGQLLGKDELIARVWPNTFVEPANLTVHVAALRRALGDGRDGNRFIVNSPGRGYQFVAAVTAPADL